MITLLNLFGRSPFTPLESHMENVSQCVHLLKPLFLELEQENYQAVEKIVEKISKQEHLADITKNDIRNHLPKRMFLQIDKKDLLDILSLQDSLADRAEDAAKLVTLKNLTINGDFRELFFQFLEKNLETFDGAYKIIKEMKELAESSFGGTEAEKVRTLVEAVAYSEHEVDQLQHKLLIILFKSEATMSYTTFFLWQKILIVLGSISNLSENLAYRVRRTLEVK